jgi:AcrR family transcriptional regulator
MPRKRTISDDALLDHALLVVREHGPEALTFSSLSSRAGLAASTIVQRFATKPELLRAALLHAWDRLEADTVAADRAAPRAPEGAIDVLVRLSGQYDPHHYADQLLLLREDLRDPVLRARGRAWLATVTDAVERRLPDAPGGPEGLGNILVAQWQGSLTVWGFTRQEPIQLAVQRSLERLLARLLAPRRAG